MQGAGAYGVSKTALVGLTNVLAKECGHMGVRVNCVAPGVIKTSFSEKVSIENKKKFCHLSGGKIIGNLCSLHLSYIFHTFYSKN